MSRLRAAARNEVKTRLKDRTYTALQAYRAMSGIGSDSAALERLADIALLGVIGILPVEMSGVSDELAQSGPVINQ